MSHKRIAESALKTLTDARAEYFADLVNRIEEDPRTGHVSNMVYLTLKETMHHLPLALPKDELMNALFRFVYKNRVRMNRIIFDRKFVYNPACIQDVTNDFIHMVADILLEKCQNGEVDTGEKAVYHFQWPHYDTDFPYTDDDAAEA